MRISKLRILDKLRRIRLDMPIYAGGDPVIDLLVEKGLVSETEYAGVRRILVTQAGAAAIRGMVDAEGRGSLRGCWVFSVAQQQPGNKREVAPAETRAI